MDGEPPSLPFGWRIGMRRGVRWWQGKAAARRRGRIASDGRTFAMAAKVLLTGRWPAAAPEPRLVMTVAAIGSYSPSRRRLARGKCIKGRVSVQFRQYRKGVMLGKRV